MLNRFKELLIKKALNKSLAVEEIFKISDQYLIDAVVESLEKMSKRNESAGRNANSAVSSLAGDIASTHVPGQPHETVELIRDALAHHISHHRANLKAGFRESADAHLNKIVPLMHLVAKLGNRVPDAIGLRNVDTRPWEVNYRTPLTRQEAFDMGLRGPIKEGADPNEFHNETQGLKARPSKSTRSEWSNLRDFRYLEMPPHPHKAMWSIKQGSQPWDTEGYSGGYPFEEIRVGGEKQLENGGGYLPIKDVEASKVYRPHAFDSHPISRFMDVDSNKFTPEQEKQYADAMSEWHNHEHMNTWLENFLSNLESNPDYLEKISSSKPNHHFDGIQLGEHPHHAKIYINRFGDAPTAESTQQTPSPDIDTSNLPQALREKFSGSLSQSPASPSVDIGSLPEALRQKFGSMLASNKPKNNEEPNVDIDALPDALKHLAQKYKK